MYMYKTHAVCRRKKIRCMVVSCLGVSLLLSVLMLVCNHGNTFTDLHDKRYHSQMAGIIRGGYPQQPVDTVVVHGQVKLVLSRHGNNQNTQTTRNQGKHNGGSLGNQSNQVTKEVGNHGNEDDEEYQETYDREDEQGYYGNQPDNKPPSLPGFRNIKLVPQHQKKGFNIEDNVDYNPDYDDDDEGDDNNEDEDEKEDDYVGDYENPTFKKGDFDYHSNKTVVIDKLRYERVQKNISVNDSHKYDAGQYKSMHLLENSQNVRSDYKQINSARTPHGMGNSQPIHRSHDQNKNRSPDRTVNRPHDQRPQFLVGIHKLHNVTFGYRKDGISYPGTANMINRDPIETQIPIQTGGHDTVIQEQPATQIQMPEVPWLPGAVRSAGGVPLIVDNIYWSQEVEVLVPQGVTNDDFSHFLHKLSTTPVREMHAPQWNRCGRPSNQYILLSDGTPLCARFRDEHVKLIHGELLSYYLSRILGLDNVPMVVLSEANSTRPQWHGMDLEGAGWNQSDIVALIQWVDGLDSERSRVKMPQVLLQAYESGTVFDRNHSDVLRLTANDLTDLLQWSDLILFDYLTAHYDRVASMQDGADREEKPSIMHENIRNLRKIWQTGKLWLLDNESGLFDSYSLLYHGGEMGRKFIKFHQQMLATNCVFRRQTVQKILALAALDRPHDALLRYTGDQDKLYGALPEAKEVMLFKKHFHSRLKEVTSWIHHCQNR